MRIESKLTDASATARKFTSFYSGQRGSIRSLQRSARLSEILRAGTALAYARMIRLPSELILEGWPFERWSILGGIDGVHFERELRSRGWQLRRWAKRTRWGWRFNEDEALAVALRKATSHSELQYRNALEVKTVRTWRLLGIYFVRIVVEPLTVYWSREHVSMARESEFSSLESNNKE